MPANILILLIAITLLWGYAWLLMKIALDYMGPFTFAFLRFVVGSLTMMAIVYLRRIPLPGRADIPALVALGFLQTAFVFPLVMYGMLFVTAGKSSILLYSMPVWSIILAYFYLNERVTKKKLAGILLGTLGLTLILGWDVLREQNLKIILGESLIVLAAVSWGAANVFIKKRFQDSNKLFVSAWQMLFGTVGLGIVYLFTEWGKPIHLTPLSVWSVFFCGVFASAFCFTGWYVVLAKTDTTAASISILFVPVVALFAGWIHLHEQINTGIIIGTILISAGVYLTTAAPDESKVNIIFKGGEK